MNCRCPCVLGTVCCPTQSTIYRAIARVNKYPKLETRIFHLGENKNKNKTKQGGKQGSIYRKDSQRINVLSLYVHFDLEGIRESCNHGFPHEFQLIALRNVEYSGYACNYLYLCLGAEQHLTRAVFRQEKE